MPERDEIAALAADLGARLLWEVENGALGYEHTSFGSRAEGGNASALELLREDVGDCRRCDLHRSRTSIVFGEGNPDARLVFAGEGPGRDEDLSGRPFVGAAGQLLDRIIGAMGLARNDVYICNVVKCRPPNNRVPTTEECSVCGRFLARQLEIIGPDVVVALGSTATRYLLNRDGPLSSVLGRFHRVGELVLRPTYHPAYLLRNPKGKRQVWNDMLEVQAALGLPPPGQARQR